MPKCQIFFFFVWRRMSSKFHLAIFGHKNSDYLPSHIVQTTFRYRNFLLFYEFLKCAPIYEILWNIYFFSFAIKNSTFWQDLWCKPHSNSTVCPIFMSFEMSTDYYDTLWTIFFFMENSTFWQILSTLIWQSLNFNVFLKLNLFLDLF